MKLGISLAIGSSLVGGLSSAVQSLLDMTVPIETSGSDIWNVLSSTKTSAVILDDTPGSTGRGGWPMLTENGAIYNLSYDVTVEAGEVTGGDFVRVATTQAMGGSLKGTGSAQTSGTVQFTGNGGEVLIGPVLICPVGTQVRINLLTVNLT